MFHTFEYLCIHRQNSVVSILRYFLWTDSNLHLDLDMYCKGVLNTDLKNPNPDVHFILPSMRNKSFIFHVDFSYIFSDLTLLQNWSFTIFEGAPVTTRYFDILIRYFDNQILKTKSKAICEICKHSYLITVSKNCSKLNHLSWMSWAVWLSVLCE